MLAFLTVEVVTFGLSPRVAFLWFATNVSGPHIRSVQVLPGPWRWDEYAVPKRWLRTKEKRRCVNQKLQPQRKPQITHFLTIACVIAYRIVAFKVYYMKVRFVFWLLKLRWGFWYVVSQLVQWVGCGLNNRGTASRFPAGVRDLTATQHQYQISVPLNLPIIGYRRRFPGAWSLSLSSAKLRMRRAWPIWPSSHVLMAFSRPDLKVITDMSVSKVELETLITHCDGIYLIIPL
jgi:hypothetical protein